MRQTYLLVGGISALAIVLVGGLLLLRDAPERTRTIVDYTDQETISIVLTDDGFEPRNVRIRKGTEVTFTTTRDKQFWPASNLHPQHDAYSAFDPRRPLSPDEAWTFTFDRVGTWGMHDHIRAFFRGNIYVVE